MPISPFDNVKQPPYKAFDLERKRYILNFFVHPTGEIVVLDALNRFTVVNALLIRSVGIRDINGRNLFEFDYIEWPDTEINGTIEFSKGSFCINNQPIDSIIQQYGACKFICDLPKQRQHKKELK